MLVEQRRELSVHLVEVTDGMLVEDHDVGTQPLEPPVLLSLGYLADQRSEVPRAQLGGAHLRPRFRPRAERPAPPRHHERGRSALRAAGVARPVRRSLAPRGPGPPGPERARPGRPLAARHLGGPPHPARAGGGGGRPAARPGGPAGSGVLEAQGSACRRRHPERASRRLSRRDARPTHGARRQRPVEGVEPPARRGIPAPRRPHGRCRARSARGRGAGRAPR